MEERVIEFLRQRDYQLVRELGAGACGKTVLLRDDMLEEYFVCKKYSPIEQSNELYLNFLREIRLLYRAYHRNIVRFFNCYVYPKLVTGYILMEYVEGANIVEAIAKDQTRINDIFLQVISGFRYLEGIGVLHRDIRPENILVNSETVVKIIDFGFGKKITSNKDFQKSISLNWCCEVPNDFQNDVYDFKTEVYFVGKLFESAIDEYSIGCFAYGGILDGMCKKNPDERLASFSAVEKVVLNKSFAKFEFSNAEIDTYRSFADLLTRHISRVEDGVRYTEDGERLTSALDDVYSRVSLESEIPDAALVTRCFIHSGNYRYKKAGFPVTALRDFIQLLKESTPGKLRIIMANIHSRLDAIERMVPMDDVPF
jgi:Serine/threonine protein kinase